MFWRPFDAAASKISSDVVFDVSAEMSLVNAPDVLRSLLIVSLSSSSVTTSSSISAASLSDCSPSGTFSLEALSSPDDLDDELDDELDEELDDELDDDDEDLEAA